MDFSNAFDKVPDHRLSIKPNHYGIREHLKVKIENFLADSSQKKVVDGEQSSPAPVTSGVPQGTVLGPLLLLVYVNDLPSSVESTTKLFDDSGVLLYRNTQSAEDKTKLQK